MSLSCPSSSTAAAQRAAHLCFDLVVGEGLDGLLQVAAERGCSATVVRLVRLVVSGAGAVCCVLCVCVCCAAERWLDTLPSMRTARAFELMPRFFCSSMGSLEMT